MNKPFCSTIKENLSEAEKMEWKWQGTSTKLKDMEITQLHSILKTLNKQPGKWFGRESDDWGKAIRLVISNSRYEPSNELVNSTESRIHAGVCVQVDRVFRAFEKTNFKF